MRTEKWRKLMKGKKKMATALKPCPFCGGRAEVTKDGNPRFAFKDLVWGVKCTNKDCEALVKDCYTSGQARDAWNRRAT